MISGISNRLKSIKDVRSERMHARTPNESCLLGRETLAGEPPSLVHLSIADESRPIGELLFEQSRHTDLLGQCHRRRSPSRFVIILLFSSVDLRLFVLEYLRTTIHQLFRFQRNLNSNDNLTFFLGFKRIDGIQQWESNVSCFSPDRHQRLFFDSSLLS